MDESTLPVKGNRYYLIQCLRFFAATFVVVFHSVFYVSTHGGQLPRDAAYYFGELSQFGILIFFAISGFVITSSIQRRTSGEFLWLRFLRIYPGFWLAGTAVPRASPARSMRFPVRIVSMVRRIRGARGRPGAGGAG